MTTSIQAAITVVMDNILGLEGSILALALGSILGVLVLATTLEALEDSILDTHLVSIHHTRSMAKHYMNTV
jgi:hypothetical protein